MPSNEKELNCHLFDQLSILEDLEEIAEKEKAEEEEEKGFLQASGTGTWLISPWPQRSELQLGIEAVADLAPCKGNKQKKTY